MFESMKELLRARESLASTQAQIAEAEKQLQELQGHLQEAQIELKAREDTIAKQDDILAAVHRQTTAERQSIVEKYTTQEEQVSNKLAQTQAKLNKAKTHFEDCERQVYCMANLYKSMRAAIAKYSMTDVPEDLEITPEEMEEIRLTEESVGLKMHSYKMEDLRKMHEANNALIEQLLVRYETRIAVPVDRVLFQIMTLAIRSELQQIVNEMAYGELNRAQVKLHLAVGKYMKIVTFAGLNATQMLTYYSSELEVLLKETLRLEYEYYERRENYERHQQMFGDPEEEAAASSAQ